MNKKQFIQLAVIDFYPRTSWDADRAISGAEMLWQALTDKGYGDNKSTPKQGQNWYGKLEGRTQEQFDTLWNTYGLKKGRDGAAMRWYQMGDVPADLFNQIIGAARKDREDRGDNPKHLQGWLFERRWEDYQEVKKPKHKPQDDNLAHLRHLQHMYKLKPDPEIKRQIEEIENDPNRV